MKGKVKEGSKYVDLRVPTRLIIKSIYVGVSPQYKAKFFKVIANRKGKIAVYPLQPRKESIQGMFYLRLINDNTKRVAVTLDPDLSYGDSSNLKKKNMCIVTKSAESKDHIVTYKDSTYKLYSYNSRMTIVSVV